MHREFGAEFYAGYTRAAVIQHGLLVRQSQIKPQGLHVNGRVHVPIRAIRIAAVRNRQQHTAHDSIRIHRNIKKTAAAFFRCDDAGQKFGVAFHSTRNEV